MSLFFKGSIAVVKGSPEDLKERSGQVLFGSCLARS